jgi:ABC-type sugar transport system ATPase subunit
VLALCGENGAGKSTLIRILSGAVQPDRGEIFLNDKSLRIETPRRALDLGISTVHQELSLLPHLSVAENLLLGRMPLKVMGWMIDWTGTRNVARTALASLGFGDIDVDARTDSLAVSVQQVVEIAKSLIDTPEILILDEPTAVLSAREANTLFAKIRDLAKCGTTVIYISHRIEEIFEISDRVLVLKDGVGVLDSATKALDHDTLVRAMVGRSLAAIYPVRTPQLGPPLLHCQNLSKDRTFRDVSFEVRAGEVVGMFGLVGSGRTDVAKALFGAEPATSGAVSVNGSAVHIRKPQDAVELGMALVTEDRKRDGLALELTAIDNGGLASMTAVSRYGILDRSAQRKNVGTKLDDLAVRPRDYLRKARQFSGGNQQKIVLAKWLLRQKTRVFIFDEPTRGVDIATKVEIYSIIAKLADAGCAVLVISSEMPEVLGLSDRLLVMRAGSIVAELYRDAFSMETVFAHAAGVERPRLSA